MLDLKECDKYYYDAIAAERPIKFIEAFLRHYEERYKGLPFILLPWQRKLVCDIFGWKRKSDHLRRFRELYLELAKGNGKSPLITAIAMYIFLAEDRHGQQIYSVATDFSQAKITFEGAKNMILCSPVLAAMKEKGEIVLHQYEIVIPARYSRWAIVSGTAEGKHGFRPDCICADEAHEWDNRKLYDTMTSNLFKRQEPLMLVATNAGTNRQSICYELHTRAQRVLDGTSKDDSLYPVLYAATDKDEWTDETVWAKANPSLGHTITLEGLRGEFIKAQETPAAEAKFRRLNLGQWTQAVNGWLPMDRWDECTGPIDIPKDVLATLPCFLGLDLSLTDDFSALAAVWIGPERLYVKVWIYVPRKSAQRFEDQLTVPITEWKLAKHVRYFDTETVDDSAKRRIQKLINKLRDKYNVQALSYDRYRANDLINRLEKEGLMCKPVAQSFEGYANASAELERRLKAGSIVLPENPCLRWQAANVEVYADKLGNIRPVKQSSKGKFAGRRDAKIDGIVSLILALTEHLERQKREGDPANALANWDGKIQFI
jgi:phage terminase large subunit-like protein